MWGGIPGSSRRCSCRQRFSGGDDGSRGQWPVEHRLVGLFVSGAGSDVVALVGHPMPGPAILVARQWVRQRWRGRPPRRAREVGGRALIGAVRAGRGRPALVEAGADEWWWNGRLPGREVRRPGACYGSLYGRAPGGTFASWEALVGQLREPGGWMRSTA